MNCEQVHEVLDDFLNGKMSGSRSRDMRLHLASCPACASTLSPAERIEILPVLDETLEPSEDFDARFHAELQRRRAAMSADFSKESRGSAWFVWRHPWQLTAVGALAALLAAGIFLRHSGDRYGLSDNPGEIAIAENLNLLQDMAVINNLDLLENFDTIEKMTPAVDGSQEQRSIE
ncbi:MAG TPA: zf-HC2 domain-containing protein [Acidobacteriota bacterium]|nr:zf-HC2 domain-containing protein [Acidobacteriota bacterium]